MENKLTWVLVTTTTEQKAAFQAGVRPKFICVCSARARRVCAWKERKTEYFYYMKARAYAPRHKCIRTDAIINMYANVHYIDEQPHTSRSSIFVCF